MKKLKDLNCSFFLKVLLFVLALGLGLATYASAGKWFTGRTADNQTQPLSTFIKDSTGLQEVEYRIFKQIADPQPTFIDLVVVLEADPQDDDRKVWVEMMEHFADGIYEATNSGHKLRNIRIYRDSRNISNADIFWKANTNMNENRTPHVPSAGGLASRDGRINMYEFAVWRDQLGNITSTYDYMSDFENAGYTMAHEMGHYYYGLFDEYAIDDTVDIPVVPSIMNSQWRASASGGGGVSNDKRWLNFSIANQVDIGPHGPFENTKATEHHRKLAASGWEVLSRPYADDPCRYALGFIPFTCTQERYQKHAERKNVWLGPRTFFPELIAFAPATGERPEVLLPNNNSRSNLYYLNADGEVAEGVTIPAGDARDRLRVIWMTDEVDMVISIDRSGSMSNTMLNQAKTAAKALVDQLVIDQARVAITSYDHNVTTNIPLTLIDSEATRDQVKAAIDGITRGGMTAIGDAARDALNKLLASPSGNAQIVFLLTDGWNNSGEDPRNVIPDYQNAQIPIFTFGYGSNPDTALMREMAEQTGGRYYYAPTSLVELSRVFEEAGAAATASPTMKSGSSSLGDGVVDTIKFHVDPSIKQINVSVSYQGAPTDSNVELIAPDGNIYTFAETAIGGETRKSAFVSDPNDGDWRVSIQSIGRDLDITYSVIAQVEGLSFYVDVFTSDVQTDVPLGYEVVLQTRVTQQAAVTGLMIDAAVQTPNGEVLPLTFVDDGTGADSLASDGLYSASFFPSEIGNYRISLDVNNDQNTAQFSDIGGIYSPGPDGEAGSGSIFKPVNENFTRHGRLDFAISDTIGLLKNWNLLSLFKNPPDKSIDNVLTDISGRYASVWSYQDGEWKVYDPLNPGLSDLNSMEAGWGYWLNMNDSDTVKITGQNPTKSETLDAGWNLVGYNSSTSHSMDEVLASISGQVEIVWAFINGQWLVYDPANPGFSDLQIMGPGYGYWIKTSEACVWTLP